MPRYVVQRTFPDGLQISVANGGAAICQGVVERNADEGVTWINSFVSEDNTRTFCVYDAPTPEAIRKTAARRALISTGVLGLSVSAVVAVTGTASGTPPQPRPTAAVTAASPRVVSTVMTARLATVKYATNLARAKADGYRILTRMIPNMGYHFLNPKVKGFNLRRPPILVYEHHGAKWQLGALEWVFPSMPSKPPLPGARYGVFAAACHYVDGTFVFATSQASCASKSPQTGAAFNFWHPRLITLHLWIWYPNPAGLYMGTNPLATAFNRG